LLERLGTPGGNRVAGSCSRLRFKNVVSSPKCLRRN
jgi:hypothetical protein